MSAASNQEANYLLHRQVTKAEKQMWAVLGFDALPSSDYTHQYSAHLLIRDFIFIEESASFV